MATTYKFLTSGVETLTANVFADQIEIYDGHPLDPCTEYVWFHDDRLGNDDSVTEVQGPTRIGAGGNTYDVDLSSVANSGDYWCEIRVGTTEDCWIRTETRTISIIECVSPQNRTLAATGASATASVRHPHYETPVFSNEGNTWIVPGNFDICDTQVDHVCLSVQSYTLTDQDPSANSARRGQATITVGTLVCFYGIAQDYIPAAPDAPAVDPAPGPFINLSDNGPVFAGGTITITAEVGTIGGTGTETYEVDFGDGFSTELTHDVMVDGTITATVRDNNGLTATSTITPVFNAIIPFTSTMLAPIVTVGSLTSQTIWGQAPDPDLDGTFSVSGGGNWYVRLTINPVGFLMTNPTASSATFNLTGPGVNETRTISSSSTNTNQVVMEFEFTDTTGEFSWDYAWDNFPFPAGTGPVAGVLIAARLF